MDKILSINTIKNVFSALGAKTSDSNYGVALLDKTTAEPKGLMGMSDLANVLGVNANKDSFTNVAINDTVISSTTYGLFAVHVSSGGSWDAIISTNFHGGNTVKIWQQETDGFYNTTNATGIIVSNSNGRLSLTNVHSQVHDITIVKLT